MLSLAPFDQVSLKLLIGGAFVSGLLVIMLVAEKSYCLI
jgi:hypothetical protein